MRYLALFAVFFHFDPRTVDTCTLAEFDLLAEQADVLKDAMEKEDQHGG